MEAVADQRGSARELEPGEAQDDVVPELQLVVSDPIPLERPGPRVVRAAIDLDHDPLAGPEEVDLHGANASIGQGLRQPGRADQAEEPPLRLGAGERRLCLEIQQSSEPTRTSTTPINSKLFAQFRGTHPTTDERLRDRTLELLRGDHRCQVEECAGRGGERNPSEVPNFSRPQDSDGMDPDARPLAVIATRLGDPNVRRGRIGKQAHHRGGAAVADDGVPAAREHGSHLARVPRFGPVPDHVHTSVDRSQKAPLDAAKDRIGADPGREQLPSRDHTLLSLGEVADDPTDPSCALTAHIAVKARLGDWCPLVASAGWLMAARWCFVRWCPGRCTRG